MTTSAPNGRPIDYYPRCPECKTNDWVLGMRGGDTPDYECIGCGRRFDG